MFAIIRLPSSYRAWSNGDDGVHCILCVSVFFLACSGACGVSGVLLLLNGGVFIPEVGMGALGTIVGDRYGGGCIFSDAWWLGVLNLG